MFPACKRPVGRRGFTLIEALMAAVLLGVGIVGAMECLGMMAKAEAKAISRETMGRLAFDKYDELVSTGQATTSASGDFTDRNLQGYTWSLTVQPSSVQNLNTVTVTVQKQNSGANAPNGVAEGLIYQPPATSVPGAGG